MAQCLPEEDIADPISPAESSVQLQASQSEKTLEPVLRPPPPDSNTCRRVKESWSPAGEGMENMLKVKKGDKVLVEWEQPEEEGGYWAYVCLVTDPDAPGYLPKKVLEVISPRREEADGKQSNKAKAAKKANRSSTEEPHPNDSVAQASLTVKEVAKKANWGGTEESVAPALSSAEEDRGVATTDDNDFPAEWLETVLDLGFSESQSLLFWNAFEHLRAAGESVEQSFLGAIEAGLRVEEESQTSEPPAKKQKPKGVQLNLEEPTMAYPAALVTENVSFVDVLRTASIPSVSSSLNVTGTTSTSGSNVDPSLSKCFKLNGKLCKGPCMFCRKAVGDSKSVGSKSAECSSSEFSTPYSVDMEAYPEPRQVQPAPVDHVCPVCDKYWAAGSIRMADFETHVNACITKAQTKAPSVRSQNDSEKIAQPASQVSEGFGDDVRSWAIEEIKTLLDRFCFMKKTDPVIVLSTLEACASSLLEMETEACGLMHSNETVKAFARKLWDCRVAGCLQPVLDNASGRGGKSGGKGQPAWGRGGGTRRGRWR